MLWILVGVLILVFTVISWKRIDFGLAIVIFSMPLYLLRFRIGPLPLTLLELIILVLVLIFVIKKIQKKEIRETWNNWKVLLKKWWLPILLFLIAATISVFVSADFKHALGRWRAYFVEPLLVFLILLDVVKSKKQLNLIIWALGLSSLLISISVICQYIFNINIPVDYNLPFLKRATSFYGYPNAIGLYLAPIVTLFCGLIIGLFESQKSKVKSQKLQVKSQKYELVFYGLIVSFGVFAVVLAVSKGAIFGILVGVFFMLMFTKWRWWIVGIAVLLVILTFVIPQTRNKVVPIIIFQETSGDVRIVLWQGTWNLIKANPIFGVGLSGFQKAYPDYKLNKHTEILVYPHNIILNFWVETGVLGLVSFVWLIVLFFVSGFKDTRYKIQTNSKFQIPNSKQISNFQFPISNFQIALMGAMVCLIAHGLVDVPYFKNDLSILFWVIVGLMIVLKGKSKK